MDNNEQEKNTFMSIVRNIYNSVVVGRAHVDLDNALKRLDQTLEEIIYQNGKRSSSLQKHSRKNINNDITEPKSHK